jgi:arylsulfatase A-like enzyme
VGDTSSLRATSARPWKRAAIAAVGAIAVIALAAVAGRGREVARAADEAPAPTAPPAAAGKARRLNIVFIVSDDERYDGSQVMRNVDRLLARHGVTFVNFNVTCPECGPSRASILSGRYPHSTGVTENFGPHGYPAFDQASDLAVWLHRAGYDTGLVGKYLNDYSLDGHGEIPPGWNDWQAMDSVPLEKYYDYDVDENGRVVHYGDAPSDYSTTVLTSRASSFLRGARPPFFLYFAPIAPHLPATPAPGDGGELENLAPLASPAVDQTNISSVPWAGWHSRSVTQAGASYTGEVRRHQLESLLSLDRSVKELVDTLAHRHMLDRTVIFYTSDNGFLWGEHRLGGKLWPYREATHVPLVVRTPWRAGNGTVVRKPVLNIDLAPTISRLAGITPGLAEDGMSFAPMLHGKMIRWRKDYLIEYLGQNALRVGGPPPYVAIHTPRYLYVEYRYRHWQELYDLRDDPWELRNVVSDPGYASTVASLRRELHRLYAAPPIRGL